MIIFLLMNVIISQYAMHRASKNWVLSIMRLLGDLKPILMLVLSPPGPCLYPDILARLTQTRPKMILSLDQTHPSHLSTFPQFEQHQSKINLNY